MAVAPVAPASWIPHARDDSIQFASLVVTRSAVAVPIPFASTGSIRSVPPACSTPAAVDEEVSVPVAVDRVVAVVAR